MNKEDLFEYLKTQDQGQLIKILEEAFDTMTTRQRNDVFSKFEEKFEKKKIGGKALFASIKKFLKDSKEGKYYAPFAINSKNFRHIPEETDEWFDILGDYLVKSSRLSEDGDHKMAVDCFTLLCELISMMERGDEIVFADEYGSWMIPCREHEWLSAFIQSLAVISTPQKFVDAVLPLIKRDECHSFAGKAYPSAVKHASADQLKLLKQEIKKQDIRTK